MSRPTFVAPLLLTVACVLLGWAAPAQAAQVSVVEDGFVEGDRGSRITLHAVAVDGDPGEASRLYVAGSVSGMELREAGGTLIPGPGCAGTGYLVTCARIVGRVIARLGDGDDVMHVSGNSVHLDGGAGDDQLVTQFGGVSGGPGADLLDAPTVSYADRTDPIRADPDTGADDGAPGEGDDIRHAVNLVGGDGDDRLTAGSELTAYLVGRLEGGAGDDVLNGGPNPDALTGGAGDDRLFGGGGDDLLEGDTRSRGRSIAAATVPAGRDVLDGGTGGDFLVGDDPFQPGAVAGDRLRGGPDRDRVVVGRQRADAPGVRVTFDGRPNDGEPGEKDDVGSDVEIVEAGRGDDTLIGDDGPNVLNGGTGNDRLEGRGGEDTLRVNGDSAGRLDGGAGADTLYVGRRSVVRTADGTVDRIVCRRGVTGFRPRASGFLGRMAADPGDRRRDCAPRLAFGFLPTVLLDRSGLTLRAGCPAGPGACVGRIVGYGRPARGQGRKLFSRTLAIPAGARRRLRIRLGPRSLRRAHRIAARGRDGGFRLRATIGRRGSGFREAAVTYPPLRRAR